MKHSIFLMLVALIFNACVDVKIAQKIQETQYFSLKTSKQIEKNCNNDKKLTIALFDIQARAPYDSKNIILFNANSLQIQYMRRYLWVSEPALMINDKAFIALQNACYNVATAPFGAQKFDFMLKLKLHSMQIEQNAENLAEVSIAYEILNMKDYTQKKSGIIHKSTEISAKNDFALAFSRLVDEVLLEIISKLE